MKQLLDIMTALLLAACGPRTPGPSTAEHGEQAAEAPAKGPNSGRMLADGPFAIELAIFETGVPPEYHAWPTVDGKQVPLDAVDLKVELHRLGNKIDRFTFAPNGNYLRGSGVVHEPHSFPVNVSATYNGQRHQWSFDSFEGRTSIAKDIAEAAGIKVETAGPATLVETISLYGRIVAADSHRRDVSARFPGVIRSVRKRLGDTVKAGETIAVIESNESLQTYTVSSPIGGVITERNASDGEQTADRALFTIVDPNVVWAELGVFQHDRARVRPGAAVPVKGTAPISLKGRVDRMDVQAGANQMVTARVTLKNPRRRAAGRKLRDRRSSGCSHEVPLAVKRRVCSLSETSLWCSSGSAIPMRCACSNLAESTASGSRCSAGWSQAPST